MNHLFKNKNVQRFKVLWILILVALLLFPLYFFIRDVVIGFDDPTMRIFYGLYDALKEESPRMTLRANAVETEEGYEFLKNVDFKFSSGIKDQVFGIHGLATSDGHVLKDTSMAVEDKKLYINDHHEVIFLDGSPYLNILNYIFESHHYFQYMDLKGFYWKKYMEKITEEMSENITESKDQIAVHLDLHDLLNSASEVLLLAKEDLKLKKDLKKSLTDILEAMLEDDYTFLNFNQSDWKQALTYMDNQWDDQYEEKIMDLYHFVKDLRYALLFLSFEEPELYFQFDGLKLSAIEMDLMINHYRWFLSLKLNEGFYADSYKTMAANNYLDFTSEEKKLFLSGAIDDFKSNTINAPRFMETFKASGFYGDYQSKYKIKNFDDFINRFKLNMFKRLELQ